MSAWVGPMVTQKGTWRVLQDGYVVRHTYYIHTYSIVRVHIYPPETLYLCTVIARVWQRQWSGSIAREKKNRTSHEIQVRRNAHTARSRRMMSCCTREIAGSIDAADPGWGKRENEIYSVFAFRSFIARVSYKRSYFLLLYEIPPLRRNRLFRRRRFLWSPAFTAIEKRARSTRHRRSRSRFRIFDTSPKKKEKNVVRTRFTRVI